jgi:hypothetical protein
MSNVTIRRILSRLTAIALSTSAVGPAAAEVRTESSCSDDDHDCALAAELTIDREYMDPPDAAAALGRSIAMAIAGLRPLDATHLVTTWALAEDPVRRLAIAHSLEWSFRLVGDALVIEHLSNDPDPAVRTAIARAAWARRATLGDAGVLARLAEDPDPEVRTVARGAG